MRKLVVVPNPVLRQKCEPVETVTPAVRELAQEMVDYMYAHRTDKVIPVGLSAPQLGEPVRMFAFKPTLSSPEGDIQVLTNPEIVYAKGVTTVREGCTSIPGKEYVLRRAKIVKIRGFDLDGNLKTFKGRGLLAQIFQHETDHLDGVLIDSIGKLIAGR